MGERGPQKQSAAAKKRAGTFRADRDVEFKIKAAKPKPPSYLTADAKKIFRRLATELHAANIVAAIDADELARLADLIDRRWKYRNEVPSIPIASSAKGGDYLEPILCAVNMLDNQITRLAKAFGMTPSARTSLPGNGPGGDPTDPLAAILNGRQSSN